MSQFSIVFFISTGYFSRSARALPCHGTPGLIEENNISWSKFNTEEFLYFRRVGTWEAILGVQRHLFGGLTELSITRGPTEHYIRGRLDLVTIIRDPAKHCVLPPSPCVEAIILASIFFFVPVPLSTLFVIIFAINLPLFKFLTCGTWFF